MADNKEISTARLVNLVFNTLEGKELLKNLEQDYLYSSPKRNTVEETYLMIGAQDLIRYFSKIASLKAEQLTDNNTSETEEDYMYE